MLTLSTIKREAGEYDAEVVQRLTIPGAGLSQLANLESCMKLVELSLPRNKLTRMEGLESLQTLERLNLAHNKILRIESLEGLHSLLFLDLRGNAISRIEHLKGLDSPAAALPPPSSSSSIAGGPKSCPTLKPLSSSTSAAGAAGGAGVGGLCCPKLSTLFLRSSDGQDANPVCSCQASPPSTSSSAAATAASGNGGGTSSSSSSSSSSSGTGSGDSGGGEAYAAAVDQWCAVRGSCLRVVDGETTRLRTSLRSAGLLQRGLLGQGGGDCDFQVTSNPAFTSALPTENWLVAANNNTDDDDFDLPGGTDAPPLSPSTPAPASAVPASAAAPLPLPAMVAPPPVAPVGAEVAAGECRLLLRDMARLNSLGAVTIAEARQAAGLQ